MQQETFDACPLTFRPFDIPYCIFGGSQGFCDSVASAIGWILTKFPGFALFDCTGYFVDPSRCVASSILATDSHITQIGSPIKVHYGNTNYIQDILRYKMIIPELSIQTYLDITQLSVVFSCYSRYNYRRSQSKLQPRGCIAS